MKFLVFLLVTLFSLPAFGQADLLTKKGKKYFYKDQVYKCIELGAVYKENQESLHLYELSRQLTKIANVSAIIGIPLFLGGAVLALSDKNKRLGVVAAESAIWLELLAIIPRLFGAHNLNKARKTFNLEMIRRHGYKEAVSISFTETANGVGIVFQF